MTRNSKDPRTLIIIGMAALIAFNISNFIVRRSIGDSWQGWLDGASGLALGVAIATVLLAARMKGRQRRGDEESECA